MLILIAVGGLVYLVSTKLSSQETISKDEQSFASPSSVPKYIAASLCSGFTSSDPAELARRDLELENVDGIHCRFDWNTVQTGPTTYNFDQLRDWIRLNNQHGKTSVIGIMLRSDYEYQCDTPYQSMPAFLLDESQYISVPGNPHTASYGDDGIESSCSRGSGFTWDIPYKQVNYENEGVKTAISNMVNAFADYLRTTDLEPGSGNNLKLMDAMGGVEIAMGHMGEGRPVFTTRGAKGLPTDPDTQGFWEACPIGNVNAYDPTHPERYSDWCHYVMNWGDGDQYAARNHWVNWEDWLVRQYATAFSGDTPLYFNITGSMVNNGENKSVIIDATNLGVGLKSTGLTANQGMGSGKEYETNGDFTYNNWWNSQRLHWDDLLKPMIVQEHGASSIPELNSPSNQRNPNLLYWSVLSGLAYHTDQFQLLASHFQPSFDQSSGFSHGVNDDFLSWAKPYVGAERDDSPGAFTVLRENAFMKGTLNGTQWFDNNVVYNKWIDGDTCYYCDRGFGTYDNGYTGFNDTNYTGNYDFFMSSDNGQGGQNIPEWNISGNYSAVSGGVDPSFPKEGMFYRRTDKASNHNEFCFNVEDQFMSLRNGNGNFSLKVYYRDDNVGFEFAHANGTSTEQGSGTGAWVSKTFNLINASLNNNYINASNRNYDFCLKRLSGDDLALHMVELIPESGGVVNQAATPAFTPPAGTYTSSVSVTLSSTTPESVIYYTLDGTTPTSNSTLYSTPIVLSATTTIKAVAYADGMDPSSIAIAAYTIQQPQSQVATPEFNPNGGSFDNSVDVTITTDTPEAVIRFTLDGTNPTSTSTLYDGPITLIETSTVKARAYKNGMDDSDIATAVFTINQTTPDTVATPTIQPNGGDFTDSVTVTLSTTTEGASIRYTLDGSEPTESSTLYSSSSPLVLNATTTVKAKGFKQGLNPSTTVSATFTKVVPAPQNYNFEVSFTFHFANIPFTVEFLNPTNNNLVYSQNANYSNGKLTFTVNGNSLPASSYKLVVMPRYYTSVSKNITLNQYGDVPVSLTGDFLGGSFSQNSNNSKVTLVDLALSISYFRRNDRTKDLDGDNKFSVSDLAIVIHSFRASR